MMSGDGLLPCIQFYSKWRWEQSSWCRSPAVRCKAINNLTTAQIAVKWSKKRMDSTIVYEPSCRSPFKDRSKYLKVCKWIAQIRKWALESNPSLHQPKNSHLFPKTIFLSVARSLSSSAKVSSKFQQGEILLKGGKSVFSTLQETPWHFPSMHWSRDKSHSRSTKPFFADGTKNVLL